MAVTKEVPMQSSHSALSRSVARTKKAAGVQSVSSSITRRDLVAGLALAAAPVSVLAAADKAHAQATQTMPDKSLYERLGGVFAIAAVVDHFSDAVVKNPIVGQKSKNPQLREWHTKNLGRLPGLKFMRTLWVCNVSGGPFQFTATKPSKTPLGLGGHRNLRISGGQGNTLVLVLTLCLSGQKKETAACGLATASIYEPRGTGLGSREFEFSSSHLNTE